VGRLPAPPAADFSFDDYRALAEFRYQIRCFLRFSEQQARSTGLEPQQHQLLLAIKGLPRGLTPTISELSKRMQLRHHSTVELVDRLVARGLVVRHASVADRREVLLALTRSGNAVLRQLTVAHREELQSAGGELLKSLRAVLRDVRKHQTNAA
jgi:DNA-binding MarR family transcriptional regulator